MLRRRPNPAGFTETHMQAAYPGSGNTPPARLIEEKLNSVQSVQGLRSVLTRYHSNIVKVGIHTYYFNCQDSKEFNGIVKANGWDKTLIPKSIIDTGKLKLYEQNVAFMFQEKRDFENTFLVVEIPDRLKTTRQEFERHGHLFAPKRNHVIYSPTGDLLKSKSQNQKQISAFKSALKNPDIQVVFVFGLYLSECVHTGVESIKKILASVGGDDIRLALNRLVTKEGKELA